MLLNITALTKTYTISGKLIIALNTVDLTFSENSFTCIVGKSGCGKTTLLRLLSGLEPATSGTIDYGKAEDYQRYCSQRRHMTQEFQDRPAIGLKRVAASAQDTQR